MSQVAVPIVLTQMQAGEPATGLRPLLLTAAERRICRGRREAADGQPGVLQLPRGEQLHPGMVLADATGTPHVVVQAAPEPLLVVSAADGLALLQAAYHLGNRHVALELHADQLRLLADPVLEAMLRQRGLQLQSVVAPFQPEGGAYGGHAHHHP